EPGASRRMVRAKSNIGPDGSGFEYDLEQIEVHGKGGLFASRVLWGKSIDGTARDLLAEVETEPEGEPGTTEDAANFLRNLLKTGAVPTTEIRKDADGAGHSWRTMQRAKSNLGVIAQKDGLRGGWSWRLPSDAPKDAKSPEECHTEELAPF